ncbi:hypothetical protein TARUN_8582 [Trichoderma arundinaceum]|uniref:Uncharacterized protein n=1 Tax=Trichoderma arundinaceum TaxID=490622 RepID=A0A395NCE4_TRIAR|nr:hypothetical protein TARUN_8582 [Trichoderma arundinaceum]
MTARGTCACPIALADVSQTVTISQPPELAKRCSTRQNISALDSMAAELPAVVRIYMPPFVVSGFGNPAARLDKTSASIVRSGQASRHATPVDSEYIGNGGACKAEKNTTHKARDVHAHTHVALLGDAANAEGEERKGGLRNATLDKSPVAVP